MPRKKHRSENVQVFEAPGFRMERHGRVTLMQTRRTPEEQRQLLIHLKSEAAAIPAQVESAARAIEVLLPKFNSFDLLALFSSRVALTNPDTYKETEQTEGFFKVEYLSLLALKGQFEEGTELLIGPDIDSIDQHLNEIQEAMGFKLATDGIDVDNVGPPSPLDELRFAARLNEFGVRGFAHSLHLYPVLRGLFEPYAEVLRRRVGFSVADALAVISILPEFITDRIRQRVLLAADQRRKLLLNVRRARSERSGASGARDEYLEDLARLSDEDLKDFLSQSSAAWAFGFLGDKYSFTARDLAEAAALPVEVVGAVLQRFSLTFGRIPPEFYVPPLVHPLKERPLIQHDDRSLLPSPHLLDAAIQPALEEELKAEPRIWKRFEKYRHDFVVAEAGRLLTAALPGARVSSHLRYQAGQRGSDQSIGDLELDLLVVHDTALVLLEVKAGAFTAPARRGAPERLDRDLKELVRKAHEQALRAADILDEKGAVTFRAADRTELHIERRDFSHILLAAVTLAPFGHLTALLHADPLYPAEGRRTVWSVNLYDLCVIAELSEPFWGLPHYLRRRVRAAGLGVEAHDELDLFGYYLDSGLYFEPSQSVRRDIRTFTDPIDAYYLFRAGTRQKLARKPRQPMTPEFARFMQALADSTLPGRLDMLLMAADLSFEARRDWMKGVVETKRRFRRDGRLHDFSMTREAEGGWALTYMCGPETGETQERLEGYCRRKAQEEGIATWCGLFDCGDRAYSFVAIVIVQALVGKAPARVVVG